MIRFPPKKILVAYDMSDVSRTAWRHAAALAAKCGAALEAVYVESWAQGGELMPPLPSPDMSTARAAELRRTIRKVVGAETKVVILRGDPASGVLNHARRHRSDLIVVGTHGRTGLNRMILGSVAEAVIRGARVPVLAARGRPRTVASILAPVNFTPYSDYGFSYAAAASAGLSARLTVLHVENDPIWGGNPEYKMTRLLARLPDGIRRKFDTSRKAIVGDPVDGILQARRGSDWIVMVAHEKSLVKDAFFGTTLEQVLRRSTIPVLAVPASDSPLFSMRVLAGAA